MKQYTVPAEQYVYAMDKDNPPALTVPSGSSLIFETCDCFHGQIQSEAQTIDSLNWDRINPATGPVFIEGAEPGDSLKVTIRKIEFTGNGIMAAIPDVGIFGDEIAQSGIKILRVQEHGIDFANDVILPVRPMIGVIGTAPATDAIPCGTPGSHGGNMDCTKIAPGSTLYLPVFHTGGLLSMGDAHACMGDGEIMGTGVEIPARIYVDVKVEKQLSISDPLLETDAMVYSIASCDTLEAASKKAAENIRNMVIQKLDMDKNTVGMLLSAIGNVEVCQIVDPKVTVRYGVPKTFVL